MDGGMEHRRKALLALAAADEGGGDADGAAVDRRPDTSRVEKWRVLIYANPCIHQQHHHHHAPRSPLASGVPHELCICGEH